VADQDPTPLDQAADVETTSSATAAAVATALGEKNLSPEAADFLRKQSRLLDLQMEGLAEDRRLQHRHLALRYFGDRLRIGLQLIAIAFGLITLIGFGALVWQAHEDHGLIVEAFSVPPDLTQQGLTGQVVAARVLDKLQAMQEATVTPLAAATVENTWSADAKVEIPTVGVSLDELQRLLRQWFGHVSRVTGEVFHTPDGLAINVRYAGKLAQTFSGPAPNFDALTQKAAEAVYQSSLPTRFAQYLAQNGRSPEALEVLKDVTDHGSDEDRGYGFFVWGWIDWIQNGDVASAQKHWLQAFALKSGRSGAVTFLVNAAQLLGHDEEAYAYALRYEDTFRLVRARVAPDVVAPIEEMNSGDRAYREASYLEAASYNANIKYPGATAVWNRGFRGEAASAYALDHDPKAARAIGATLDPGDDPSFLVEDAYGGVNAAPGYDVAVALDDWPTALAIAQADDAYAEAQKGQKKLFSLLQQISIHSMEALAMAKTGDVAGAEALVATTPTDCYPCLRVRGQIAAIKGDWVSSDRWFAEAAKQAPSLPQAPAEWGRARLLRGDADGAIAMFDLAHQKGSRFADPLEGWGEALMRKGDYAGAVAKFSEADQDAPHWGRNHMMWGEALAKLGRGADAKAQYQAAAGTDLSFADRATLTGLLGTAP
jgi:hypothetical protein